MNTELAQKALQSAKASPEKFNMRTWFTGPRGGGNSRAEVTDERVPPCGTTACYAGWVAFHHAPLGSKIEGSNIKPLGADRYTPIELYATEALGITRDQAGTLFYLDTIGEVEKVIDHLTDDPAADGADLWIEFAGSVDR